MSSFLERKEFVAFETAVEFRQAVLTEESRLQVAKSLIATGRFSAKSLIVGESTVNLLDREDADPSKSSLAAVIDKGQIRLGSMRDIGYSQWKSIRNNLWSAVDESLKNNWQFLLPVIRRIDNRVYYFFPKSQLKVKIEEKILGIEPLTLGSRSETDNYLCSLSTLYRSRTDNEPVFSVAFDEDFQRGDSKSPVIGIGYPLNDIPQQVDSLVNLVRNHVEQREEGLDSVIGSIAQRLLNPEA